MAQEEKDKKVTDPNDVQVNHEENVANSENEETKDSKNAGLENVEEESKEQVEESKSDDTSSDADEPQQSPQAKDLNETEQESSTKDSQGKNGEDSDDQTPPSETNPPDFAKEESNAIKSSKKAEENKGDKKNIQSENEVPAEETEKEDSADQIENVESVDQSKEIEPTSSDSSKEQEKEKSESGEKEEEKQEETEEDKEDKKDIQPESKTATEEVEKAGSADQAEQVESADQSEEIESDEKEEEEKEKPEDIKSATKEESQDDNESEDKERDEEEEEDEYQETHLDYSNYTKPQLVQVIESQLKNEDMSEVGEILKEIKPAFDDVYQSERDEAYKKYREEGGEKDGFEYKNDELDNRFLTAYNKLKDRRNNFYSSLEQQREQNLFKKQAILEKLREIVDSDETVASLKELKEIQEEWKNTGPVAPQHLKSLWANYNALIDRYYDQRSIYFELKELDRKKNLEAKLELCERAEALEKVENIKDAIKVLNELHEEFKHIGPVPKDDQEPLWIRFKAASDAVYAKRKEYYESLKQDLKVNQVAKEALAEKVQTFSEFESEKISDWNQKTKEILEIQKEWESIGGLPREVAKDINKRFWSAFKGFFSHKGQFFKKIEKARQENLKVKEELVQKAEELKDSEDFAKTAEILKELQRNWRDIGPVPEKFRNEIYKKFKSACDHFFNRKRENEGVQEKSYVENLKKKESLCEEIEKMASEDNVDLDRIDEILEEWPEIGYVPKHEIKNIQNKFNQAIAKVVEKADVDEDEAKRIKITAQFSKLRRGPNSQKIIQKKENSLRRQIAKLENDIDLWKNNLNFFADSKTADKLKDEFNEKIKKATRELHLLEEQLRTISNF